MKSKFKEICEGVFSSMSPGMSKAVLGGSVELKKECDSCGFLIPKYAGRYPICCPMCKDPITKADIEVEVPADTELPIETHVNESVTSNKMAESFNKMIEDVKALIEEGEGLEGGMDKAALKLLNAQVKALVKCKVDVLGAQAKLDK